ATLNDRLAELGAAAIGYDVLFPEADRLSADNDAAFAKSLGHTNSVLGFSLSPGAPPLSEVPKASIAISGSDPKASLPPIPGAVAPLPLLNDAAAGLGSLSLDSGTATGVVRQVPLLWSDGTNIYPGLSIETLRLALGASTLVALGDTAGGHTLESLRIGDFTVPTTADGNLVVYDRPFDMSRVISAAAVLGDGYASLKDAVSGRIILIGTSASGLLDLHATPLSPSIAGVLIHAGVIDQIISGQYLVRADWLKAAEILAFVATGLLLVFVVLRVGPVAGLAVAVAAILAMAGVAWTAFAVKGWQIDATFPAAALLVTYGAMVYFQFSLTERDRRAVRRAFGYYVAPQLLAEIERKAGRLELGGELKEISVMFADMRGFTSFTEKHTPQDTLNTLNTLFGALGKEIVDRYGTIDKFIGDAIMAFWNAPVDVPEHPRKAALAAIAMRTSLRALNVDKVFGDPGIAVGIGIATGVALVGNMGLETRFDYSTIGDPVNVASRVEGESKVVGYDIVAAEPTAVASPELAWLEAGSVQLKGKAARLKVFILVGDEPLAKTAGFVELAAAHRGLLAALRGGEGGEALALCKQLGAAVDPQLARFYELVPGRIADFLSPA
ncbi:MAG TPA: adenylate/guanylate cyclase domain-containing protein, partial [Devosia sp.]|nr:adenylate/guanylate cyclase domain-containing protein [Devosia sp.]